MRTVIVDSHNLVFRLISAAYSESIKEKEINEEYIFKLYRGMVLYNILSIISKLKPERLIFAIDSGNVWRKEVYSLYKAQREKGREDSVINFDKFFPMNETLFNNLKKFFSTIYFLRVKKCEGDDIVNVLVKKFKDDECIAVSTDKDFYQNFKYKNYKQWNPIKKDFVKVLNPSLFLEVKILMGDTGDNIPDVENDVLGNKIKTAEKLIPKLSKMMENESFAERYKRNKTLIDFNYIPQELQDQINKHFDEYEYSDKIGGRELTNWIINDIPQVFDSISEITTRIKVLK